MLFRTGGGMPNCEKGYDAAESAEEKHQARYVAGGDSPVRRCIRKGIRIAEVRSCVPYEMREGTVFADGCVRIVGAPLQ